MDAASIEFECLPTGDHWDSPFGNRAAKHRHGIIDVESATPLLANNVALYDPVVALIVAHFVKDIIAHAHAPFIVSSLDLNPRLQTGRGFSRFFVHRLTP